MSSTRKPPIKEKRLSGLEFRTWRIKRRIPRTCLARKLGIHPRTLSKYESMEEIPEMLELALNWLKYLIGRKGEDPTWW